MERRNNNDNSNYCRKPSQAKAYAEAFSIKNRTKTYIELEPCSTFKSGAYLTWGIGHLIQLKKPQEYKNQTNTWDLKTYRLSQNDLNLKWIQRRKHNSTL